MPPRFRKYTRKTQNNKRHNKTQIRSKKGGNCGCSSITQSNRFLGGSNSVTFKNTLLELPSTNYYPLNKFDSDPNYSTIASRQTGNFVVKGGKRSKQHKSVYSRKRKNMKKRVVGGNLLGSGANTINSTLSNIVVGANNYAQNNGQFFSVPYSMYSEINPPPPA